MCMYIYIILYTLVYYTLVRRVYFKVEREKKNWATKTNCRFWLKTGRWFIVDPVHFWRLSRFTRTTVKTFVTLQLQPLCVYFRIPEGLALEMYRHKKPTKNNRRFRHGLFAASIAQDDEAHPVPRAKESIYIGNDAFPVRLYCNILCTYIIFLHLQCIRVISCVRYIICTRL